MFGVSQGCRSYGFYRDDVGTTHCDLYGGSVAYVLDVLDGRQNGTWFDKECGNPMDDGKWHTGGTEPRSGAAGGLEW
ncbi:hypothetical protein QBC39DRAFT_354066 [Podospora conica]|nr:hypothetical protein QBC39DRAFT_354066 [Schizothecium conicum]